MYTRTAVTQITGANVMIYAQFRNTTRALEFSISQDCALGSQKKPHANSKEVTFTAFSNATDSRLGIMNLRTNMYKK